MEEGVKDSRGMKDGRSKEELLGLLQLFEFSLSACLSMAVTWTS